MKYLLSSVLLAFAAFFLMGAAGPDPGTGSGGGGGSATNAIVSTNGTGSNTFLANPTFTSSRNYTVTNMGTATNLVGDWNGPGIARCQLTNNTTLTMTNAPAAGSAARTFSIQVINVGGPSNLTVQTAGPIPITWRDGLGPNINQGATNFIDLSWDGTNVTGFTRQDNVTGVAGSAVVLSNQPSIFGPAFPGHNVATGYRPAATNGAGKWEWTSDPRVGVYRTMTIGAAALVTNLTSGSLIKQEETVANFINRYYHEFSGTLTNIVTFSLPMPEAWDRGQVQVKVYWSSTNAAANQTNVWGIATSFVDDDDPIDAAYGTEVVAADPVSAANDLMISTAFTPTPGAAAGASGALLDIRLRRLPGHVDDQMGGVAKLYAIVVRYLETTTEPTSSW